MKSGREAKRILKSTVHNSINNTPSRAVILEEGGRERRGKEEEREEKGEEEERETV